MNKMVTSSFFDNGYLTLLDIEIKDYIRKNLRSRKQEFFDILCQREYKPEDVKEELKRQCSYSTLRMIPSEDAYVSIPLGMDLWYDICNRIHDQESMIAGRLQLKGSSIKMDIYRTDFQSPGLKKRARALGLRRAPVMRWTQHFQKEMVLRCLDRLMLALPFTDPPSIGDYQYVLNKVQSIVNRKPLKARWAWLIIHPVVQVQLTPSREDVLHTLFWLSNGPVEWKGTSVCVDEIQMHTRFPMEDIEEAVGYFKAHGIVRQIEDDLTPTVQGYMLLQRAFKFRAGFTFAIIHKSDEDYQLEVSTPTHLPPEIQDVLKEHECFPSTEFNTPAVSPLCEKSHIDYLMDILMRAVANSDDVNQQLEERRDVREAKSLSV